MAVPLTSAHICAGTAQTVSTSKFIVDFPVDSISGSTCPTYVLHYSSVQSYRDTINDTATFKLSLSFFAIEHPKE